MSKYVAILRPLYRFPYALLSVVKRKFLKYFLAKPKKYNEIINQINKKGFADCTELFSQVCHSDLKKIEQQIERKVKPKIEKSFLRFLNFHLDYELPKTFLDLSQEISENFFKHKFVRLESTQYQISLSNTDDLPGMGYHIDDYGGILKFYVFFHRMDENNGPFRILTKSKHFMSFFKGFVWLWLTKLNSTYFDSAKIDKDILDSEEKIFCDDFSIFAIDTSFLHSSSKIMKGERRVMVLIFRDYLLDLNKKKCSIEFITG